LEFCNEDVGTMPPWQADAFNLKKKAEEIVKYCPKLSSGHPVRDGNIILEHRFLDLFWNHEKKAEKTKTDFKPVVIRRCRGCQEKVWKCKLNPCEIRLQIFVSSF